MFLAWQRGSDKPGIQAHNGAFTLWLEKVKQGIEIYQLVI